MKSISLKTIFIIIITIIIICIVFNKILHRNSKHKDKVQINSTSETKNNDKFITSDNLRIGIMEFDNINPILSNNKNVQDISRFIFDPLFNITEEYKLEPCLASECSKIAERTYILKLKEGIKWHDGNTLDSSDVFFTIDMLKELGSNSVYYHNVKTIESIEKVDEYTLKIINTEEDAFFEYNLIFPIVSSKYYNKENFKLESTNLKPVGTGMFYISDIDNEAIFLRKSATTWNNKDIYLQTITINLYNSLASVVNAFRAEEIDVFTTSNTNINEYLKSNTYSQKEYVNRNYVYAALNCSSPVLQYREVRQAINSAINKEEIVKNIYNNKYRISNFPLDYGSYSYNTYNPTIVYSTNTAKALLLENNWQYTSKQWIKNTDNNQVSLKFNIVAMKNNNSTIKVANKIKDQLKRIGMDVTVVEVNEKDYNNYLQNKNYDMIILNATYGYSPSLNKYFGDGNYANYYNEEVNSILSEIKISTEDSTIKENYSKIVDIYNNDVPYISLCFNQNTMIYTNNLKGDINPNSYNPFYKVESWHREYKSK